MIISSFTFFIAFASSSAICFHVLPNLSFNSSIFISFSAWLCSLIACVVFCTSSVSCFWTSTTLFLTSTFLFSSCTSCFIALVVFVGAFTFLFSFVEGVDGVALV